MESVKRIFNNTVVVFVLAILAVASIVAATFINIDTNAKRSLIKGNESKNETIAVTTDLDNQSGDAVKKAQYKELNSLMAELQTITSNTSSTTDIIDRYIEVRYNYTDGPDKERILKELNDITRKFFLGKVDNSLNYLKGDSKAEILKRYAATDSLSMSASKDNGIGAFVYIVNINGVNKVIEYTVLNESGKRIIYDEKEIGTVEDKDIETKDLLAPDIIKSTDESTAQPTLAQEGIKK